MTHNMISIVQNSSNDNNTLVPIKIVYVKSLYVMLCVMLCLSCIILIKSFKIVGAK